MLLTMNLHFETAMQLLCGVPGIFTKTGVAGKLSWGQLSEFLVQTHAAAYAVEDWYRLHQQLARIHVVQVSHSRRIALQLIRYLHCTCIVLH